MLKTCRTLSDRLNAQGVDELLTVEDVAALLKVSKGWVYEHIRSRSKPRSDQLPHIKVGKYIRLINRHYAGLSRTNAEQRDSVPDTRYNQPEAKPRRANEEERVSLDGSTKRQYGSGCLLKRGKGWAIRWRELEIAPDGTTKKVLRYEALGKVSREEARTSWRRGAAAPARSRRGRAWRSERSRTNGSHGVADVQALDAEESSAHLAASIWCRDSATSRSSDVTRQEMQAYIAQLTQAGYAPKTIDHIHDVFSAVLRTAVKWGHLQDNPARDVDLPALRTVRPKWALTIHSGDGVARGSAAARRGRWSGLALLSGLRRGELFALALEGRR